MWKGKRNQEADKGSNEWLLICAPLFGSLRTVCIAVKNLGMRSFNHADRTLSSAIADAEVPLLTLEGLL